MDMIERQVAATAEAERLLAERFSDEELQGFVASAVQMANSNLHGLVVLLTETGVWDVIWPVLRDSVETFAEEVKTYFPKTQN